MILVYSVTPIHVGMGRSAGVVDLPIQRDAIGYPVIFSSSFKGALKALCAGDNIDEQSGRINCEKARICCCAFGSEPLQSTSETGTIVVTDLIPFAVPVPSEKGYKYLTSFYLLRKIKDIALMEKQIRNTNDEVTKFFSELNVEKLKDTSIIDEIFYNDKVISIKINIPNTILSLGELAKDLSNRLVIANDEDAVRLFDKSTIKFTRNRIDLSTKTAAQGSLWTEEYLPEGTIFVGGIIQTNRKNKYCDNIGNVLEELKKNIESKGYLNLGGKESIGKGLVKIKIM